MLSFKQFFTEDAEELTEGIRQGLPHISTMDHHQFGNLSHGGRVHFHAVTEKSDGATHMFGHDHHGFYTQSSGSGSERMRSPQDYIDRATRRSKETGKPLDLTAAHAFGHVHKVLGSNHALQKHLRDHAAKHGEAHVKGELFYKPLSKPSESHPGHVKFVGTSYDTSHMGHVGKIVIHSKLETNASHDVEHFKKHLSDKHINFDDDKLHHKPSSVNIAKEHKAFHSLDHNLLTARTTPSNKDAKAKEHAKFEAIKKSVSDKVDRHVSQKKLSPKWGPESEGVVVHPHPTSGAPRFKVTSHTFRTYKADPANKVGFKTRGKVNASV